MLYPFTDGSSSFNYSECIIQRLNFLPESPPPGIDLPEHAFISIQVASFLHRRLSPTRAEVAPGALVAKKSAAHSLKPADLNFTQGEKLSFLSCWAALFLLQTEDLALNNHQTGGWLQKLSGSLCQGLRSAQALFIFLHGGWIYWPGFFKTQQKPRDMAATIFFSQ